MCWISCISLYFPTFFLNCFTAACQRWPLNCRTFHFHLCIICVSSPKHQNRWIRNSPSRLFARLSCTNRTGPVHEGRSKLAPSYFQLKFRWNERKRTRVTLMETVPRAVHWPRCTCYTRGMLHKCLLSEKHAPVARSNPQHCSSTCRRRYTSCIITSG